ncbi:MAG: glutathione S-transferase family protein [Deltaproteobacteria bacterium]|nr:glutathione S-transferase family protein [Deltaproteobacteria bacterium]
MKLRLYDWAPSPFCLKVRAILDYKGLAYERVPLLSQGGRHLLGIRRRGRVGKVPALEVDGRLVVDSTDIAEELERLAPEPTIYPAGPRERALSHAIEEWADESLYFVGLYYQWIEPAGSRAAAEFFRRSVTGTAVHLLLRRRIEGQVVAQGTARKPPEHVARDLERHLDALAALTSPGPFLFGEAPMLSDFALLGQLTYLSRTPRGGPPLARRKEVAAYLERFKPLRRASTGIP